MVGIGSLVAPEQGSAIAIGTLDGVHIGHKAMIEHALAMSDERGVTSVVVTWDRHPAATLAPDRTPPLVTSPERKIELLAETGIDAIAVLPFDEAFSKWPPERFVSDVLVKGLEVRGVFVGEGWRFGHKAAGDVDLLKRLGAELGFDATAIDLVEVGGEAVSSTRVRAAVRRGDMAEARALLGRRFDLDGLVIHGDDRGAALGWPTANLAWDPALAIPARGVYAGRGRVGESWYPAAINVGVNPTFGGEPGATPLRVEAFLLDFEGDLYDQTLRLEFWARLRDEERFSSTQDLVDQIGRDVEATRALTC